MTPEHEVSRLLTASGAVLVRTNGHRVYRFPDGGNWITPLTPSDWRSWKNNLADLRRRLGIRPVQKMALESVRPTHKPTPPTSDRKVWREYVEAEAIQPLAVRP